MNAEPLIVVEPPDSRGLREVRVRGEVVGRAWSLGDLRGLLRRAEVPEDLDLEAGELVEWRGGGSEVWPDRPWRRRATSVLIAVGLLVTAGVLGKIGKTDVSDALSFGGRVAGATFLFASIVEVIAAICAFDYLGKRRWVYSGAAVLVGVVIALALNALMLAMQIDAGEYSHYAWIWPTTLIWAFWALRKINPQQIWRQSPHPKKVATGAAVAGLISIGNLLYSRVYVPYSSPLTMDISVKFGESQLNDKRTVLYVPMTVTVKNSGKVPLYILGTLYTVYGRSADFTAEARGVAEWKADIQAHESVDRNAKVVGRDLISSGEVIVDGGGSFMEPGDVTSEDRVLTIPANSQFDSLEGVAQAVVMRPDRATLSNDFLSSGTMSWDRNSLSHVADAPKWVAAPGDEYLKYQARLYYSNEILNATRRPRYATIWWVVNKTADGWQTSYLQATISLKNEEARKPSALDSQEMSESYGLYFITSATVREPFAALVKPPAR
ncbi:hypothetical protein [Streptomyces lavendulae]|uniref:hypothetical protein n=1 Tax=Streptomyces lavendulae TaxID=1914 RepID=UPI0024A1A289|nr:hypothetical protein [Streptomyces lavendulae]GLX16868.1 hypothetical protein Slala01_05120 [Streptomyces lavendulae subsp. lavendulae]GLX25491.1 hypothetical protein Slala02_13110 [Streptomyces lavendulae subsp. lavendulae]